MYRFRVSVFVGEELKCLNSALQINGYAATEVGRVFSFKEAEPDEC